MDEPGNECFYQYAQLGRCMGYVDKKDEYGNPFCEFHYSALPDIEEISALAARQNITFVQATEVFKTMKNFKKLMKNKTLGDYLEPLSNSYLKENNA